MVNIINFQKASFTRMLLALPLAGCIYFAIFSNDMMTRAVALAIAVAVEGVRDAFLIAELTVHKK
ncbi:Uncharacterised protein [Candidatus Gugararchaeum adminiculabundum]|nr:Uncharacterised protein [Candidatus Gugararchaeum adminiculabundum]